MRNIKDINKILAKAHFKCIFLNDAKKQHIFVETCLYEAVGSLSVLSSLLPHVLLGRSQVSLFFASVVSPVLNKIYYSCYCQLCPIK